MSAINHTLSRINEPFIFFNGPNQMKLFEDVAKIGTRKILENLITDMVQDDKAEIESKDESK
jgi:hypothetical protein